ncbi:hypothetical protein WJX73_010232 [Symbiochloris irregularis]|uniref:LAGLIDADG homing endonuclease n=1 Tax=Symbiochloris irregularis TaxID=706552 RepID=A0AAW1NY02_9CHLO
MCAMYQNQSRVCLEFLKSSRGCGKGREIKLNYSDNQVPLQLQGRVDERLWHDFMRDVLALRAHHPYLASPRAGQCCEWGFCGIFGLVFGFCMVQPDSGVYPTWLAEVQQMLDAWQSVFQQRGVSLSLQITKLIWIQMDITQNPQNAIPSQGNVAQGYPVPKT